jgi:aspartate aminotransferase
MQFSRRVSRISISSTGAVLANAARLKASGVDLVDFGAGEPDFPTPDNIKQAAVVALQNNFTRYTPISGTVELRQAVVDRHGQDFGSKFRIEECIVTPGGKYAIFEVVAATINAGDEVILPVPYWVSFLDIINYAGGKAVLLETSETDGFAIRSKAVEKLITAKTKLIIVNSPNNPTGTVVPTDEMESLLHLAVEHDILLLSDECYGHFVYDGRVPFSLGRSKNRNNLVLIGSLSKTYAMTGWRVGFALGSSELIARMLKVQSHSTSNANSIAQKAAVEALLGPQHSIRTMLTEYSRRRDLIVAGLRSISGIRCNLPEGAFYVYPNVAAYLPKSGLVDTGNLANRLLYEAQVATVPGLGFGTAEHLRISYATSQEEIEKGLRRLDEFFHKLSVES